jgi:hypothetical protein
LPVRVRCGREIAMKWPTPLSGFFGLESLVIQVRARLFPEVATPVVGEIFDATTISVARLSRFKLCQFSKCTFAWEGEEINEKTKIFLSCNFDDCDFGMPTEQFVAYTFGSTINGQYVPRLTRQQALEEAVRRIHQRQPTLTEQCLDPSSRAERERLAQWVNAEYRKILMDA